jgi:hypothetical protein
MEKPFNATGISLSRSVRQTAGIRAYPMDAIGKARAPMAMHRFGYFFVACLLLSQGR